MAQLMTRKILAVLAFVATKTNSFCLLCGDIGVDGLKRPEFKVDQWGKTCSELTIQTAFQYEQGTDACMLVQEEFGDMCCGDEEPVEVKQRTNAPQYDGESKTLR